MVRTAITVMTARGWRPNRPVTRKPAAPPPLNWMAMRSSTAHPPLFSPASCNAPHGIHIELSRPGMFSEAVAGLRENAGRNAARV